MIFSRGERFSRGASLKDREAKEVSRQLAKKRTAYDIRMEQKLTMKPSSPSSPIVRRQKVVPYVVENIPGPGSYYRPISMIKKSFNKAYHRPHFLESPLSPNAPKNNASFKVSSTTKHPYEINHDNSQAMTTFLSYKLLRSNSAPPLRNRDPNGKNPSRIASVENSETINYNSSPLLQNQRYPLESDYQLKRWSSVAADSYQWTGKDPPPWATGKAPSPTRKA